MISDHEGFYYPSINKDSCIDCGRCAKVCPILNPGDQELEMPEVWAAKAVLEAERMSSSSGGVFGLFCNEILKENGVVVGATFDEKHQVHHRSIFDSDEVFLIKGSKYVQSTVGTTYVETEQYLKQGKSVLYSGTPCQIAGLSKYLGREYDNLITISVACHGTPSPKVWGKYLVEKENDCGSQVTTVCFRDKRTGWKNYSFSLGFADGGEYTSLFSNDAYMLSFLMNYNLRPSCYNCKFKGASINSDIQLADFWGIESIAKNMDDDKGTSLVLTGTDKGKKLIRKIEKSLELCAVPLLESIEKNGGILKSASKPKNRERFWDEIDKGTVSDALKIATHRSFATKVIDKVRRILN